MTDLQLPTLDFHVHTDLGDIALDELEAAATRVLPACLAHPGGEAPDLPGLEGIEISLVGDEDIARVHGEFFDDPTATDVITFPHGEILVSVETAAAAAPEHGNTAFEETLLYLIHGFLHLNGHIDTREPDRARMHGVQEIILAGELVRRGGRE